MKINTEEISIEIKLSSKDNLEATAVLNFGDFTVKGFRLSVSEHENDNLENQKLWLQPPSYRVGRTWQMIFFVEDKNKWKTMERMVYEKYKLEKENLEFNGDDIWPKGNTI